MKSVTLIDTKTNREYTSGRYFDYWFREDYFYENHDKNTLPNKEDIDWHVKSVARKIIFEKWEKEGRILSVPKGERIMTVVGPYRWKFIEAKNKEDHERILKEYLEEIDKKYNDLEIIRFEGFNLKG